LEHGKYVAASTVSKRRDNEDNKALSGISGKTILRLFYTLQLSLCGHGRYVSTSEHFPQHPDTVHKLSFKSAWAAERGLLI